MTDVDAAAAIAAAALDLAEGWPASSCPRASR